MAHYQDQYAATTPTDEYGNPIRQTDEYGNPIRQTDEYGNPTQRIGTTGSYGSTGFGTTGYGTGTTGTGVGGDYPRNEQFKEHGHGGGVTGMFHRSGSGSSSSSEDDGHGGRRKKGLKEKIKEKMPGGHRDDQSHTSAATTPGDYDATGHHHEKKGMMDKIKEKLPGHGHH